jgi:hypothetical protein
MSGFEIRVVVATERCLCVLCAEPIQPGERIEYSEGPPRRRVHAKCGLRARRAD